VFSNPPFFVTLLSGLMLAFAFQLLLTNLGVAVGITALGFALKQQPKPHSPKQADESESSSPSKSSPSGKVAGQVGFAIGFGTLLTINTVLFLACFLSVKLSLVSNVAVGAILGVVIWSAYYLILVWLSSTVVSPLLGSAIGLVTSGFRGLLSAVTSVFQDSGDDEPSAATPPQLPEPFAAPAAGFFPNKQEPLNNKQEPLNQHNEGKQELPLSTGTLAASINSPQTVAAQSSNGIQTVLKSYLQNLPVPKLDLQMIQTELEGLLSSSDLVSVAGKALAGKVDRSMLMDALQSRTDFSPQDISQAVQLVEGLWQKVFGQPQQPQAAIVEFLETVIPDELTTDELNTRLDQLLLAEADRKEPGFIATADDSSKNELAQSEGLHPPIDFKQLFQAVLKRTDLSELEAQQILAQLQAFRDQVGETMEERDDRVSAGSFGIIQLDVENYLLNAYPWQLKRKTTEPEFEQVLYDPEADPEQVRQQLERLNRDHFKEILKQRGDLKPAKINRIADQLEAVWLSVLERIEAAIADNGEQTFGDRFADYLRTATKSDLVPAKIQSEIGAVLTSLLKDAGEEAEHLLDRMGQFNHEKLVVPLQARQDLTQAEIEQIIKQVQAAIFHFLSEIKELQARIKTEAEALWQKFEAFLQDPDQKLTARKIQRQLKKQVKQFEQESFLDLRKYLPKLDRKVVVEVLQERQDLTERRVQQVADQVEKGWSSLLETPTQIATATKQGYDQIAQTLKTPRRFAVRAQTSLQDFQTTLEDYLRHTDKEELNPEAIKNDLKLLLHDPQTGLEQWADRLSEIDRSTLVALLAQRPDLTEAEANQIVNQMEAVRQQLIEQVQTIRQQTQERLDSLLDKIRTYFSALNLPDLNYEGIQTDLQKLLNLSQEGFESLGDHLQDVNRDTLIKLVSARQDLSQFVANQIVDRVDAVRLGVLEQTEQLRQEAENRLQELRQQAQQQAEATRKTAAIAAWWLFSIVFTSAVTSAIAGAMAVKGFSLFTEIFTEW
jgi:hypothetical protein